VEDDGRFPGQKMAASSILREMAIHQISGTAGTRFCDIFFIEFLRPLQNAPGIP
jgi:hypothetical protein